MKQESNIKNYLSVGLSRFGRTVFSLSLVLFLLFLAAAIILFISFVSSLPPSGQPNLGSNSAVTNDKASSSSKDQLSQLAEKGTTSSTSGANSTSSANTNSSATGKQSASQPPVDTTQTSSADSTVSNTTTPSNGPAKTNHSSSSSVPAAKSTSSKPAVPSNLVPAVVSKNVDGDTIHVRLRGKDETIRMLLIDTPEDVDPVKPVEPYGYTAANYAKKVLPVGKHIYLEEGKPGHTRGKYGRLLAFVYITPHDMYNEDVVKRGLARVAYVYPPNTQHLSALDTDQNYAKSHHKGIWSVSHYVTSSGYSLSIACPWAAQHNYSTRGCPSTTLSSAAKASTSSSSPNNSTASSSSSSGTLAITSSQLSVTPGHNASVTVNTKPGVTGKIQVDYKSGPSSSKSLDPKIASSSGSITWTWRVGSNTTPGNWTVTITANGKTVKTTLHVK